MIVTGGVDRGVCLDEGRVRFPKAKGMTKTSENKPLCINRHPNLNSIDRPVYVRNIERHTNINELPCTFLSLTLLHIDIKSFNCCIDQSTNLIPGIYI